MTLKNFIAIICFSLVSACQQISDDISGIWINPSMDQVALLEVELDEVTVSYADGTFAKGTIENNEELFLPLNGNRLIRYKLLKLKKGEHLMLIKTGSDTSDSLLFFSSRHFTKCNESYEEMRNLLTQNLWTVESDNEKIQFLENDNCIRSVKDSEPYIFSWSLHNLDSIFFIKTARFHSETFFIEKATNGITLKNYEDEVIYNLSPTKQNSDSLDEIRLKISGNWRISPEVIDDSENKYYKSINFHVDGSFMPFDAEASSGEIVMGDWSISKDGNLILLDNLNNSIHDYFQIGTIKGNEITLRYQSKSYKYFKNPT